MKLLGTYFDQEKYNRDIAFLESNNIRYSIEKETEDGLVVIKIYVADDVYDMASSGIENLFEQERPKNIWCPNCNSYKVESETIEKLDGFVSKNIKIYHCKDCGNKWPQPPKFYG